MRDEWQAREHRSGGHSGRRIIIRDADDRQFSMEVKQRGGPLWIGKHEHRGTLDRDMVAKLMEVLTEYLECGDI